MNKKVFILLIFLLMLNFVDAEEQQKVIKTHINLTIMPFNDGNLTRMNLTINNEDEPIKITGLIQNASYQSEPYLITLIRNIECESSDLKNLTLQCLIKLDECDIKKIAECENAKGIQYQTIQFVQAENSQLRGQSGNLTLCQTNLNERQNSLTLCTTQVGESNKRINDKWYYLVIGLALGGLAFWGFGENTKKSKGYVGRIEKDYGTKPTAQHDIPVEFKQPMEDFERGKLPIKEVK